MARQRKGEDGERDARDARSAALFGSWLRKHNLTIDGFANESGVGRSTVSALAGAMGVNAQTRWSGVRRGTLELLHRAVERHEPMTLQELGQRLAVDVDSRPLVWAPVTAYAGGRSGAVTVMGVPLFAKWDILAPDPPHVAQGPSGELAVTLVVPPGWERLGRLVSLTPQEGELPPA